MTTPVSGYSFTSCRLPLNESQECSKKTRFSTIMQTFGKVLMATGRTAASMIPGGSAITAFFDSFGQENMMGVNGGMTPMEMLGIQQEMLQEARIFTLLSNIMRLRHDAAMNALRNIK
ncbi:hypothetical protein JW823_06905 [bacterium]|nr:hypothetical protein [candidate division CSSED10-310 bacterium]